MATPIIIKGPETSKVSKDEAQAKLLAHPRFPKDASFTLDELEGRWIAAIAPKESAPPDAFLDAGGAGDTPSGPPEPGEAPKGPDESPESDEPKGEEKPKKDGEKGDKSEKGELGEIKELLTTLLTALGLSPDGPGDSPVPGLDEGPPPPPPGPPDAPGSDNKTHTVHERALKPGEAPPGTTPIGSPSFASVAKDHPWYEAVEANVKSFKLAEAVGDTPMSDIHNELKRIADGTPYKIEQLVPDTDESGQRIARALIVQK
jgi:hypothetical protein